MKYIRELVKKIPHQEYQKLCIEAFTKKELTLIQYYKEDSKEDEDLVISDKLQVKLSTLKKLQSSLVVKVVENLSSNVIYDQIVFLSDINCHRLIIHISKKKLNEFKKQNNFKDLKKLLLKLPYSLLSALVTDYSLSDLKMIRASFLKLEKENSNDYYRLNTLLLILELYQYDNWSQAKLNKFKEKIDALKIKGKDVELNFWKTKLLGDYYKKVNEDKYMDMLKLSYEQLSKNKISLPFKIELNINLQYCFYLVHTNQFEETYQYYKQMELKYPNHIGGGKGMRYVDLISQVCIVLGKYDEARNYIFEAYPIEKEKPAQFSEIYFGNTTILAMLDILENNMELAYVRIQAAKRGLKKQYFIFLDSLLRLTEQAYYLKMNEFDFADTLHQKNIKFYQYHNTDGLEILENGHKILAAYSKQNFDKKLLSTKLNNHLKQLKQREFAFIGHFIEKLNPNLPK